MTAINRFQWPDGKKAAVSLTFDDARLTQIDKGIPILNEFGLKASFYVSFAAMEKRLQGWREALLQGHEVGNHTVLHPCSANFSFTGDNGLEDMTLERIESDIREANGRIREMLGITPATFAYPCGMKYVGRGENVKSYVPVVARHFTVGRGFMDEWCNDPFRCDLAQAMGVDADCKSFAQLKYFLDLAVTHGGWLIFVGHNMAIDQRQSMGESLLRELGRHLTDAANGLWVDTVAKIGSYIQEVRKVR